MSDVIVATRMLDRAAVDPEFMKVGAFRQIRRSMRVA
jgi:hypothetical protein